MVLVSDDPHRTTGTSMCFESENVLVGLWWKAFQKVSTSDSGGFGTSNSTSSTNSVVSTTMEAAGSAWVSEADEGEDENARAKRRARRKRRGTTCTLLI